MIFFFSFYLAEQNEIGAVCLGLKNCLFSKSWLSVWLFYMLQTILAWELAHHQVPALKGTGCWCGSECITRGQGVGEKCDGEVRPGWVGARAPCGWRWGVRRGLRESWGVCVCLHQRHDGKMWFPPKRALRLYSWPPFYKIFVYLAALALSCGMWDLVPQPGIESRPWEWRAQVTGPPGKSLQLALWCLFLEAVATLSWWS